MTQGPQTSAVCGDSLQCFDTVMNYKEKKEIRDLVSQSDALFYIGKVFFFFR